MSDKKPASDLLRLLPDLDLNNYDPSIYGGGY